MEPVSPSVSKRLDDDTENMIEFAMKSEGQLDASYQQLIVPFRSREGLRVMRKREKLTKHRVR